MTELVFPLVICNGLCGMGKAASPLTGAPFFHAEMFSEAKDSSWNSFSKTTHFQPATIFPIEDFPHSSSANTVLSCKDTPEDLSPSIHLFQEDDSIKKVVLAKKRTYTFKDPVDPLSTISTLIRTFPKDRVFAYMPDASTLFFGTTPENLYIRAGNHVTVDCIAGTVLAGDEESLFTPKLVEEHQFVTSFVKTSISPLLSNLQVSDLGVKSAGNVSHLYQTVSGTLQSGITDKQIIDALHPTPATLGHPSQLAKLFLKEHEPFDRGMYAGILGWITEDTCTLKVCLRSGLAKDTTLSLFAGAGITDESVAADEIVEIDNKFKTLEEVFLEKTMSHQ